MVAEHVPSGPSTAAIPVSIPISFSIYLCSVCSSSLSPFPHAVGGPRQFHEGCGAGGHAWIYGCGRQARCKSPVTELGLVSTFLILSSACLRCSDGQASCVRSVLRHYSEIPGRMLVKECCFRLYDWTRSMHQIRKVGGGKEVGVLGEMSPSPKLLPPEHVKGLAVEQMCSFRRQALESSLAGQI